MSPATRSTTRSTTSVLRHLAALVLVASAITGCYRDSDAFVSRAAKLKCVNARECNRGIFDATFDRMRDCRDTAEAQLHDQIDPFEDAGCEYIAENGRECIRAMFKARKECGPDALAETTEACDAVFVCPDGLPRDGMTPGAGPAVLDMVEQDLIEG